MKKLLIFSKCKTAGAQSEFHFKGFYRGNKISSVKVNGRIKFFPKNEYLLWVQESSIEGSVLIVDLIAWKLVVGEVENELS